MQRKISNKINKFSNPNYLFKKNCTVLNYHARVKKAQINMFNNPNDTRLYCSQIIIEEEEKWKLC